MKKGIISLIENLEFKMDIKEYLPKVEEWKGGFDKPFDLGYLQAKKDLIKLLKNKKDL